MNGAKAHSEKQIGLWYVSTFLFPWCSCSHCFTCPQTEFKALPSANLRDYPSSDPTSDPRTDSQWFLFEEFVPFEYRDQLSNPKKKRTVKLFSTKQREWKPAATLNGKPYTGLPRSPSYKTIEFDELLNSTVPTPTRQLSLHRERVSSSSSVRSGSLYAGQREERRVPPITPPHSGGASRPTSSSATVTPTSANRSALPRFRLPGKRPQGFVGSAYDAEIDFETLTASETSSGSPTDPSPLSGGPNARKAHGKEDAWVDIFVADHQHHHLETVPKNRNTGLQNRSRSDPELANEEIQRALGNDRTPPPRSLAAPSRDYDQYSHEEEEEIMEIPLNSATPAIHVRSPTADSIAGFVPPPSRKLPPPPPRSYEGDQDDDFEPVHENRYLDDSASNFDDGAGDIYQTHSSRGSSPHRPNSNSMSPNHSFPDLYEGSDAPHGPVPPPDPTTDTKASHLPIPVHTTFSSSPSPPPLNLEPGQAPSPSRYVHGMPLQNVEEED